MSGWQSVQLGDVCDVLDSLRRPITKRDRAPGPIPYYGASGVLDHVEGQLFDEPLVLLGEDGAKWESGAKSAFAIAGPAWVNNHAHVLRPQRDKLDDDWLIYYLNFSDLLPFVTGLTVPKLNQEMMRSIPIPLPPLADQKHIVAILDEAFEGIRVASGVAAKNAGNARSLFQETLAAKMANDAWPLRPFEECVERVRYTNKVQRKDFRPAGRFPIVSQEADFVNGFWDDPNDLFRVSSPIVVFGDHTRVLKFVDFDFVLGADGVKLLKPTSKFDAKFFYYAVRAIDLSAIGYARHYRLLKEAFLPCPALREQLEIVELLDELEARVIELEAAYKARLALLVELQQSFLARAFSGELTREPLAA